MAIRVAVFTILGIGAIAVALVYTVTNQRGIQFDLLIGAIPPGAAVIFGSQKDILQVWVFWKKYEYTPAQDATSHPAVLSTILSSRGTISTNHGTANASEIAHFSRLSSQWWDERGEFSFLHKMNPVRVQFIREKLVEVSLREHEGEEVQVPKGLRGLNILDVGCGGGLLSESLARLGANTLGIDASESNIKIAQLHAANDPKLERLSYLNAPAETLVESSKRYDVVCSLEVLEHVDNPATFLSTCAELVKPGGHLFLSTISRTPLAYLLTIFLAEDVLRKVSRGTHTYSKFIKPTELVAFFQKYKSSNVNPQDLELATLPKAWISPHASPESPPLSEAEAKWHLASREVSPQDEIYRFDIEEKKRLDREAPWTKDPHYFKACKISAVALIKMVIHARSGVPHEIMGLMQGKVVGNTIVIMDSFALPVQGTETRVSAANEANEYMVEYIQGSEKAGRLENAIGWYHSHPGYGCWLSGIDVNTQIINQKFQDPFVAVVIDPNRTISAGKVDIGAFRTYPEGYTPPNVSSSEYQSIPLNKIEDFGVHANQYYQVDVEIFKSTLDNELLAMLWNKYWVNTLSSSPLISNRAYSVSQLSDLHQKLSKAQTSVSSTRAPIPSLKDKDAASGNSKRKKEDNQLAKSVKDSTKIAVEAQHGLISQVIKDVIFSMRLKGTEAAVSEVSEVTDMAIG
ncbi:hypothetical protein DXG01_002405 [Tephrocybe rancida]|nr:hypothetical protein DXG01_002405 [Tephrocybe rancida]